MSTHSQQRKPTNVRFYCGCPKCGAVPGERCISPKWGTERSNHPERNARYDAMVRRVKFEVANRGRLPA